MKPGSIILNQRQNSHLWNGTSSISPEEKIESFSVSGQGHDHCLLLLWRNNSYGCNMQRGASQLLPPTSGCWQNSRSVSDEFGLTRIQQKSCVSVTVLGHTQVLMTQAAVTKFDWSVLPRPPYNTDLAPSDFHPFGAMKDAIHSTKF